MVSNVVRRTSCRQITLQITASRPLRPMMVCADMPEGMALEAEHHRTSLIDRVPTEPAHQPADRFEACARVHLDRATRMKARRADFTPCGSRGLEQRRTGDTERRIARELGGQQLGKILLEAD